MSKIKSISKIIELPAINVLGQSDPVSFSPSVTTTINFEDGSAAYPIDMQAIDPDSPLMRMDCDSLDDYRMFIKAGHFIRDGYWYVGEGDQHVFSATAKEIAIAKQHEELRYPKKSRLELITD